MDPSRRAIVRSEARKLLIRLWDLRNQVWETTPALAEFVRQAPEIIVSNILGVSLEKPEEIRNDSVISEKWEIAGLLDREARKIVVAQKFPAAWRRFTTAHEIGHWVLHTEELIHRDRPLMGGERANRSRPKKEQEADLFAAELLMPSKFLSSVFVQCFGNSIDGSKHNDDLAFWLSASCGQQIGADDLVSRGPMFRAMLVAKAPTFAARSFAPLSEQFNVSPTAMAIQLLDLGLVI